MKKGLQIFLLGLIFLLSGVAGYLLEDILINETSREQMGDADAAAVHSNQVAAVSNVPVIDATGIIVPKRDESGKYSFAVKASVESGHQLKYVLYSDSDCAVEVASNLHGTFQSVPASSAKIYYLRVQNVATGDFSEIYPVNGFEELKIYNKITKDELEKIFNVDKDWTSAPKDYSLRIAKPLTIKAVGVREGEREVAKPEDICLKVFNGIWNSVIVEKMDFDSQNRLKMIEIKVNY